MSNKSKDIFLGVLALITIILIFIFVFKVFVVVASVFHPFKLLGTILALIGLIIIYCNIMYKKG
jgi:hypothetical protein